MSGPLRYQDNMLDAVIDYVSRGPTSREDALEPLLIEMLGVDGFKSMTTAEVGQKNQELSRTLSEAVRLGLLEDSGRVPGTNKRIYTKLATPRAAQDTGPEQLRKMIAERDEEIEELRVKLDHCSKTIDKQAAEIERISGKRAVPEISTLTLSGVFPRAD